MPLIPQQRERYVRSARLRARPDGGATLWAIAWEGDLERVLAWELDAEGAPAGEPREVVRAPAVPDLVLPDSGDPSTTDDPAADDEARAAEVLVAVRREGGASRVELVASDHAPVVVWRARGFAAAPALARVAGGTWIAWHHDVREDTGVTDVVKWIALRFVDDRGAVIEPVAPMIDRDRDREGEEQGWEFPTLVAGGDGALAIFGRGSHRFWRQDLSARGFGPRTPIGEGGWGCRGRRVAAVTLVDGALLTARREKEGIVVERAPAPSGGRPALAAARVDVAPRADATVRIPRVSRPRAGGLEDGRSILFGDIHQHSAHSDGCGTAAERYVRAREEYGDDFAALSDHESFLGKRIGPGEWRWLERVAERYDDPGAFATLFAYEWTGRMYPGPGHKCVYWPHAGMPVLSRDDVPDGAALVKKVRELGGICVPHHTGWTGADAEAHDPAAQPVWEICSCHGCYETPQHPLGARGELSDQTALPMLQRGLRFGFVACSDGHGLLWHHGVGRKRDPFRCGLTGIQARGRTRADVFEALRSRRCFATSGAKIALDLRVNGAPMGSEIAAGGPVEVRAAADGTDAIRRLELVGPSGVLAGQDGSDAHVELSVRVAAPFVYARVEQIDGEMAWTSPIWITEAPSGGGGGA